MGVLSFEVATNNYYYVKTTINFGVGNGSSQIHGVGYFGGFASQNDGLIKNCDSAAAIQAKATAYAQSEGNWGENNVYARTYMNFGTVACNNNNTIMDCETLVGSMSSSTGEGGNTGKSHPQIMTMNTANNTLVCSNNGIIQRSVATTS